MAAALRTARDGAIEGARVVIGSAASRPLVATDASKFLTGRQLNRESIEEASSLAAQVAKPLDNTDFDMTWRKRVATEMVSNALRELRGDDMSAERTNLTRQGFYPSP